MPATGEIISLGEKQRYTLRVFVSLVNSGKQEEADQILLFLKMRVNSILMICSGGQSEERNW